MNIRGLDLSTIASCAAIDVQLRIDVGLIVGMKQQANPRQVPMVALQLLASILSGLDEPLENRNAAGRLGLDFLDARHWFEISYTVMYNQRVPPETPREVAALLRDCRFAIEQVLDGDAINLKSLQRVKTFCTVLSQIAAESRSSLPYKN